VIKRSSYKVENNKDDPFAEESNADNRTIKDEQIVMRDKSKYGCWGNKYKEFTINVKVPHLEDYSKVVGSAKPRNDEEEDAGFDVHEDEELNCAKMLSCSTVTELITVQYFLRFYAQYEHVGISAVTREIPIKLVSNPAHE